MKRNSLLFANSLCQSKWMLGQTKKDRVTKKFVDLARQAQAQIQSSKPVGGTLCPQLSTLICRVGRSLFLCATWQWAWIGDLALIDPAMFRFQVSCQILSWRTSGWKPRGATRTKYLRMESLTWRFGSSRASLGQAPPASIHVSQTALWVVHPCIFRSAIKI